MPARHARFSPSASSRYLHCPPALRLEEQFQDSTSSYAEEGTAGHALAEHLIKKFLKQQTKRPVSDYYTAELVEAVDAYVAYVQEQIAAAKRLCRTPFFAVEQQVDLSQYVADCFGTADMVIITNHEVHLIDLKLGRGVEVSAEHNTQLMMYGLGVLQQAEVLYDIKTVTLTIFQPRLSNCSTWEISATELKDWGETVLKPMGAMALAGTGEFQAGDWCRFCKARYQCRERAAENLTLAKLEFREPDLLTDNEIAWVLTQAEELSRWASDVYAYAQEEAITHGKQWDGFKLVEGRRNRKYTSEEDAAKAALAAGYTEIYKQSLLSVTEMERLMGKKDFARIMADTVYKPDGKLTLVPLSDKRMEVSKCQEFTEVTNYE